MNKLIITTLFILFLFTSCKKNNSSISYGSWKINGLVYNGNSISSFPTEGKISFSGSISGSIDSFGCQVGFTFCNSKLPTYSGRYIITGYPTSTDELLIIVTYYHNSQFFKYFSMSNGLGINPTMADVVVNNSKITITIPALTLYQYNGSDTLKASFSGSFTTQ